MHTRSIGGLIVALTLFRSTPLAAAEIRQIEFPVFGTYSYSDDFGDPRGSRTHEGIDIITAKHTPVVSAIDGRVGYLTIPEASWGYAVYITDADGYEYHYLHLNNDTPGTDDGAGGPQHAFAPGISFGAPVTRGQLIGWAGDSGNAENVGSHLHFEIRLPNDTPINPYESLRQAEAGARYDRDMETNQSSTINVDKNLVTPPTLTLRCITGSLIKTQAFKAIYYCGADGRRYVFPNDRVYFSWYPDFSGVTTVDPALLADIPIGGNVTYRPGVKLVKLQTDPHVYAVAHGGELRHVTSPGVAAALYGPSWPNHLDDLSEVFFTNYRLGRPIFEN